MMNKILLTIVVFVGMVGFSGCCGGPASYNVFKIHREMDIGASLVFWSYRDKDIKNILQKLTYNTTQIQDLLNTNNEERHIHGIYQYDDKYYIYIPISSYPKNCIYGYIVEKNYPYKIVDWKIIAGEEYCKEQDPCGEVM